MQNKAWPLAPPPWGNTSILNTCITPVRFTRWILILGPLMRLILPFLSTRPHYVNTWYADCGPCLVTCSLSFPLMTVKDQRRGFQQMLGVDLKYMWAGGAKGRQRRATCIWGGSRGQLEGRNIKKKLALCFRKKTIIEINETFYIKYSSFNGVGFLLQHLEN